MAAEPAALAAPGAPGAAPAPMTPVPHRVISTRPEAPGVATLVLAPVAGPAREFRPGQFNMLTALGVGEAAISISSAPSPGAPLEHTVREVGPVTRALVGARPGDVVGVRGPFGTDWGVEAVPAGSDVVVVAGGIGLAPLRGAVELLVADRRRRGGRVFVMVGARRPSQIIFGGDLGAWSRRGAAVGVTVDIGEPGWAGNVGVVTALLDGAGFAPQRTTAMVCGPEIMMRFAAWALLESGVAPERILVSLERNMRCGVGWCGHCQLGPYLLCRDGPVRAYTGTVAELMTQRER